MRKDRSKSKQIERSRMNENWQEKQQGELEIMRGWLEIRRGQQPEENNRGCYGMTDNLIHKFS